MAIDGGNLRVAVEDGIEGLHIIDGALEGGTHSIDDKHRARDIERLLQLLGNHAAHGITLDLKFMVFGFLFHGYLRMYYAGTTVILFCRAAPLSMG